MTHPTAQQIIEHLGMTQLPVEATFFVSTYRSVADTATGGPVGTAMIGMYSDDPPSRSLFHRLTSMRCGTSMEATRCGWCCCMPTAPATT